MIVTCTELDREQRIPVNVQQLKAPRNGLEIVSFSFVIAA